MDDLTWNAYVQKTVLAHYFPAHRWRVLDHETDKLQYTLLNKYFSKCKHAHAVCRNIQMEKLKLFHYELFGQTSVCVRHMRNDDEGDMNTIIVINIICER